MLRTERVHFSVSKTGFQSVDMKKQKM